MKKANENSLKTVFLDDLDRYILQSLQKNSKTHYDDLALKKGKAKSTIANRIKRLIDEKVITNWTVQINAEKIGFDLTVLISIQIDVAWLDEVNRELTKIPELYAIYNVTGDYDVVAIGRFQNRQHLDKTIHKIIKIPHIQRTSSNVALRTLKEDYHVHFLEED
ncbi:MAG: Lrp/AsnC family transcriptional regulator [Candidatus Kariarchaeaceae archaeon]|jgi:Lrp/AsnC family transcriptional regulator for asnA, asnC and gidA